MKRRKNINPHIAFDKTKATVKICCKNLLIYIFRILNSIIEINIDLNNITMRSSIWSLVGPLPKVNKWNIFKAIWIWPGHEKGRLTETSWKPPDASWTKMNCDGAVTQLGSKLGSHWCCFEGWLGFFHVWFRRADWRCNYHRNGAERYPLSRWFVLFYDFCLNK